MPQLLGAIGQKYGVVKSRLGHVHVHLLHGLSQFRRRDESIVVRVKVLERLKQFRAIKKLDRFYNYNIFYLEHTVKYNLSERLSKSIL